MCRRIPKRILLPLRAASSRTSIILDSTAAGFRPRSVEVALLRDQAVRCRRRTAEVKWRMRLLNWRKTQARAFYLDVAAVEVDSLAIHLTAPNGEKFFSQSVALIVREKDAIPAKLRKVATRDNVDEQPTLRNAIEGRSHPRGDGRSHDSRLHRNQQAKARGCRGDCRSDHLWVFARTASWNQDAVESETICRLRGLQEIAEAELAPSRRRREITPIAVSR